MENADFDIDTELILISKKKLGQDQKYSTPYTLLDLDYGREDVVERLKELTVAEYSETKIDKDDLNPPILFVFGKDIDSKLIYVKLKIKVKKNPSDRFWLRMNYGLNFRAKQSVELFCAYFLLPAFCILIEKYSV